MSSLKPICVKCQRFYRPSRNGVWFLEGMPTHNGAHPGKAEAHHFVGVARDPYGEHYQPDFKAKVEATQPYIQVNDC
jgi:hypothetical protein